jgi:hypothetical protein
MHHLVETGVLATLVECKIRSQFPSQVSPLLLRVLSCKVAQTV